MAHFSQLDTNNKVLRNIVISNNVILDENNVEQEQLGIDFCKQLYGNDTIWVQSSYNGTFRHRLPQPNDYYYPTEDVFMPEKPYDYYVLYDHSYELIEDGVTKQYTKKSWVPNVAYPDPTYETIYNWNHETRSWDLAE